MDERFFSDAVSKEIFSFADNDRRSLENISVGSVASICVKNGESEVTIRFSVTRDAHLGTKARWVYGLVLGSPDGEYYQVEIRINKEKPEMDTVKVFPQAPPNTIKILR